MYDRPKGQAKGVYAMYNLPRKDNDAHAPDMHDEKTILQGIAAARPS